MNADCRLKSGFTLIELLTAISVIAVLSSLLLSAAFMAKQRSSRGGCISNVRQLQLGWTMYADENDGRLAINTAAWKGVWRSESNSWTGFSSAVLDETPHQIMQGSLWPYVQAARVFVCPSDHSLTRTRKPRVRSYSLNGNLAGRTNEVQNVAFRMDQIPEPARLLSFICEHEDSIDDGHFLVWPYPDDRWVNMPSGRHANAGVLSFCDGHLETWIWRAPKRFKDRTTYWKAAETAEDRADLIRLQNVVFLAEKYRRQP